MAIRGTIEADYSKFEAECQKAEQGLADIAKQGAATEQSLVKMENSVASGKIADSISKTVASVDKVGVSSRAAASRAGQLADGMRTADRVMSQFGVNLGPTIGSLDEMARMSGQTVASLGKLGTAFGMVAAAQVGWNIGRWIADLTGADQAIADLVNTIMGRGSVATEEYGYKLDTVRLAQTRTSEVVRDYSHALEINARWLDENKAKHMSGAAYVATWEKEITTARGGAAALRAEIEAGNLTQDEMAAKFKVSGRAIEYLEKQMKAAAAATREQDEAHQKAAADAQAQADAIQKLQDAMFGVDAIAKAQTYLAALGSMSNLTRMSQEAQASMNTTLGQAIDAYTRMGQVAPQALRDVYTATLQIPPVVSGITEAWGQVGEKVTMTADAVIADSQRMQAEAVKAAAAYQAETDAMVQAYIDMQQGAEGTTQKVNETTAAHQQLTVALREMGDTASTAYERAIAGANLLAAYSKAGVATSGSIGLGGYEFAQLQKTGVPGGWAGVGWAQSNPTSAATQPWGNQNTLNVNVNNADASKVAEKLVDEMKHQGYRL